MLNPFPINHIPFPCSFKIRLSIIFGLISLVLGVILLVISCDKLALHRDKQIECDDGEGYGEPTCFDALMFVIAGALGIIAAVLLIASIASICFQHFRSWIVFHLPVFLLAAAGFALALYMHLDAKTKQPEWVSLITIFGLVCAWSAFGCATFIVLDLLYPNVKLFKFPLSTTNLTDKHKEQGVSKSKATPKKNQVGPATGQAISTLGSIENQGGQSLTPNENLGTSVKNEKEQQGIPGSTPNDKQQDQPISSSNKNQVRLGPSPMPKKFRWTFKITVSIIFGLISLVIGAFLLIISCYMIAEYREMQAESAYAEEPIESSKKSFEADMIMVVAVLGVIAVLFLFASFGWVCYQDSVWWFCFHMIVFFLTLAGIIILLCFTISEDSVTDEWTWLFIALVLACIWSLLASILIPIDHKSKQKVLLKVRDVSKSPEDNDDLGLSPDENLGNSSSREEELVILEPEPVPIVEPDIPKPARMFGRSIPRPAPIIEPEIPEPVPIVKPLIPEPIPVVQPEVPKPAPMFGRSIPRPAPIIEPEIPKPVPIIPKPLPIVEPVIPKPIPVVEPEVPKPAPMFGRSIPRPAPIVEPEIPKPLPIVEPVIPKPIPVVEPEVQKLAPMFGRSIPRPAPIVEPEIPKPVQIIPKPLPIVEPIIPKPIPVVEPEVPKPIPVVEPEVPKPAPIFGRSIPRPAPIVEPEIPKPVPIIQKPVPIVEPIIPKPLPIVEPVIPKPRKHKTPPPPKPKPIPKLKVGFDENAGFFQSPPTTTTEINPKPFLNSVKTTNPIVEPPISKPVPIVKIRVIPKHVPTVKPNIQKQAPIVEPVVPRPPPIVEPVTPKYVPIDKEPDNLKPSPSRSKISLDENLDLPEPILNEDQVSSSHSLVTEIPIKKSHLYPSPNESLENPNPDEILKQQVIPRALPNEEQILPEFTPNENRVRPKPKPSQNQVVPKARKPSPARPKPKPIHKIKVGFDENVGFFKTPPTIDNPKPFGKSGRSKSNPSPKSGKTDKKNTG